LWILNFRHEQTRGVNEINDLRNIKYFFFYHDFLNTCDVIVIMSGYEKDTCVQTTNKNL